MQNSKELLKVKTTVLIYKCWLSSKPGELRWEETETQNLSGSLGEENLYYFNVQVPLSLGH